MPQLAISLLGPLRATLDETPVSGFVSKRAQALLAYLAVEAKRPHTREEVQGLLWPEYPDSSARANLRSVLANLRRVIGDPQTSPPFLHITRETIQFNLESNHLRDIAVFETLPTTRNLNRATVGPLEMAVSQAQGPLLAGFALSDSPTFEEWLIPQREFFNRQLLTALRHLAEYYEEQGAYDQAISFAQRSLMLDSWQEETHQRLIYLYARSGRRNQAIAHFEACRRILATELGVEPSEETIGLVERIRRGEITGERQPSPKLAVARNLRRPTTPLIGRATEVAALTNMLAHPLARLITIVGPGGIGKTHLALEVAAGHSQLFHDGVVLIELAPLRSADDFPAAIAKVLDFTFDNNAPPEEQLFDYLRDKEMLLVMDNFEHLLDGVEFIHRALDAAPHLKILATSRIRLQARDEEHFTLDGLAYPDEPSSATDSQDINEATHQAIALFLQSVRRVRPEFFRVVSPHDLVEIGRICRLVRGLPLAILLASAWIEILTPTEIADEIEGGFQFLEVDGHSLPKRHHRLQSVFEHSLQLLSAEEQAIFMHFALFRGGCTREAAQVVTGATLPHLLALTSKFFLSVMHNERAGATNRYEVHELLRQFAAHKLSRLPNEESAVRRRHSLYYLSFLSRRGEELKGSRQVDAYIELEADVENIRLAWQWAVEEQQLEALQQATNGLGMLFEWRGRYQDGEAACRAAVEQLAQVDLHICWQPLAAILTWQARFNRYLGQSEFAYQLVQRGLELLNSPSLDDQDVAAEKAAVLFELGVQTTNHVDANQQFQDALTLFRSVGDRWGAAQCLCQLGDNLSNHPGTDAQGQRLLKESLELYQALGDRRNATLVLNRIGFFAMLRGQHAEGEFWLRQSLSINREMGSVVGIANSLIYLAYGLLFVGKYDEALHLALENLLIAQNFGNRPTLSMAHALLAAACMNLGRYEDAHEHTLTGLQFAKELNYWGRVSFYLWILGDCMLAKRAYAEAEEFLQESISMHREMANLGRMNDVVTSLGYVAYGLGQIPLLRRCLTEALEMSVKDRLWFTAIKCIPLAALLAIAQEQVEEAVELYALALCVPHIANSPWYEEIAGRHIHTAAQALPAHVVDLAQERGRSRDLWKTVEEVIDTLHLDPR
jgi:DNA-binding SARP family transcriptional activator/predicted ATPase